MLIKNLKRCHSVTTRSFEDAYDYGYDDWAYNEYWQLGTYDLYYDPNNNQTLIDYDGDGKPDAVWLPEVDIIPDEPYTEPEPIPDPMPEPMPEPDSEERPTEEEWNEWFGGLMQEEDEPAPDVDPCEKANEMNMNENFKDRVQKIFEGVYYQPYSKENGWINDGNAIHDPNKQGQGSIKYDWSAIKQNSVIE